MIAVKWTGFLASSYGAWLDYDVVFYIYNTHLGECLDLSTVAGGPLTGQEAEGTMAGGFVLSILRQGWSNVPNMWDRPYGDCGERQQA